MTNQSYEKEQQTLYPWLSFKSLWKQKYNCRDVIPDLSSYKNSQLSAADLPSLLLTGTCTITSFLYPTCSDRKCDISASVHGYHPWGDGLLVQGKDEEDGHAGFWYGSTASPPHDSRPFVWEMTCHQACLHSDLLTFFRHPTSLPSGIQQVLPFKQASVTPHLLLHNISVYSKKKKVTLDS